MARVELSCFTSVEQNKCCLEERFFFISCFGLDSFCRLLLVFLLLFGLEKIVVVVFVCLFVLYT